jgi:hypothetical protein
MKSCILPDECFSATADSWDSVQLHVTSLTKKQNAQNRTIEVTSAFMAIILVSTVPRKKKLPLVGG